MYRNLILTNFRHIRAVVGANLDVVVLIFECEVGCLLKALAQLDHIGVQIVFLDAIYDVREPELVSFSWSLLPCFKEHMRS